MPASPNSPIEAAARAVVTLAMKNEPPHIIAVEGPPTSGKTAVLHQVASKLKARTKSQRKPAAVVLVDVPYAYDPIEPVALPVADDAAAVMLTSAAAQLSRNNPQLEKTITDLNVSWNDKAGAVLETLQKHRAFLLIDEPPFGSESDAPFASLFAERARSLLRQWIETTLIKLVIASNEVELPHVARVRVHSGTAIDDALDPSRWNGLGTSANRLFLAQTNAPLAEYSPLELRLAVALVHAGVHPQTIVDERPRGSDLIERLFDRLGEEATSLRRMLGALALVRTPFHEELLGALGRSSLGSTSRTLLESAILFGDRTRLRLHETISREAARRRWLNDQQRALAHQTIARYYRGLFASAKANQDVTQSLRSEVEVVHHLTQAGDASVVNEARVFFVDQLDALGKALSIRGRFEEAVACYSRALEHDETDWYARHYRAFNRDVRGIDHVRVEQDYVRAYELAPQHVWNYGRLACFYATRARSEKARQIWLKARSKFALDRVRDDPRLYNEIHRHLARLLLHRGELELAREILDDVPVPIRAHQRWYAALERLLEQLDEAERDQVVFPMHVPIADRWSHPHAVPHERRSEIAQWTPGRVAIIDDHEVHLRVARKNGETIDFGWKDIPIERLESEWGCRLRRLSAGAFVELVTWHDQTHELFTHSPAAGDPDLPSLHFDPSRYLKNVVA